MTLLKKLQAYSETLLPMHMPGGKRRFASALPYHLDVTEVEGLDDLHDAHGILAKMQQRATMLWNAERSFVLVGGSTAGLLAAVRATGGGDILLARNCHKSVYNAVCLCKRHADYVLPTDGEIRPQDVERALCANPSVTTVVITSPTYEGVISDVKAIAKACQSHGVTLIVDEAHGAHLGFAFGASAITLGADIVVQSLHKTLPALTQTALLHCKNAYADTVARELAVFQSSSPSYILMASADECFAFLASDKGKTAMQHYNSNLLAVRQKLQDNLVHFHLLQTPNYDIGKLVILTGGTDCTGVRLAERLRTEYRIETEMALPESLTAMTSVCDGMEELNRFADAVLAIDQTVGYADTPPMPALSLPEQVCDAHEVYGKTGENVPFAQAQGRVSLDYVWAYPPGIPLLVPGERVSDTFLQTITALQNAGITPKGMQNKNLLSVL